MCSITDGWEERWRLNRSTFKPEKVRVLSIDNTYVLIEGEQNTTYRGNVFDTPEAAFVCEIEDAERSIRYGQEKKQRVLAARERWGL